MILQPHQGSIFLPKGGSHHLAATLSRTLAKQAGQTNNLRPEKGRERERERKTKGSREERSKIYPFISLPFKESVL